RDGRFWFDYERQREWEFTEIDRRLGTRVNDHFALAQEAYSRSGRDLADNLTPEQQLEREKFHQHLAQAAELQQEIVNAKEQLKRRWAQWPPIRRSIVCLWPTAAAGAVPGAFVILALSNIIARRRMVRRRKRNQ